MLSGICRPKRPAIQPISSAVGASRSTHTGWTWARSAAESISSCSRRPLRRPLSSVKTLSMGLPAGAAADIGRPRAGRGGGQTGRLRCPGPGRAWPQLEGTVTENAVCPSAWLRSWRSEDYGSVRPDPEQLLQGFDQLQRAEGLDQVVVGAGLLARFAVLLLAAGGQQHDLGAGHGRVALDALADLQAVELAGHHHVQQHHVRADRLGHAQTEGAVRGLVDLVVLELQRHPDQLADVGLVLDDQNALHEGSPGAMSWRAMPRCSARARRALNSWAKASAWARSGLAWRGWWGAPVGNSITKSRWPSSVSSRTQPPCSRAMPSARRAAAVSLAADRASVSRRKIMAWGPDWQGEISTVPPSGQWYTADSRHSISMRRSQASLP